MLWMLGFQRRGVRRWECDTDMPKPGPLPHTLQMLATELKSTHRRPGEGPDSLKRHVRHPDDAGAGASVTAMRDGDQTRPRCWSATVGARD